MGGKINDLLSVWGFGEVPPSDGECSRESGGVKYPWMNGGELNLGQYGVEHGVFGGVPVGREK